MAASPPLTAPALSVILHGVVVRKHDVPAVEAVLAPVDEQVARLPTPLLRLGQQVGAAGRALDAAVRLLQGRTGRIDVVYLAQLSSVAMLSPGAIAEIESDFDEIEQELRTAAAEQLGGSGAAWEFERRQASSPTS